MIVKRKKYIVDILDEKAGIRTITSMIDLWNKIDEQETKKQDEQKEFFRGLGLLQDNERNTNLLKDLFDNIISEGKKMLSNNNSIK